MSICPKSDEGSIMARFQVLAPFAAGRVSKGRRGLPALVAAREVSQSFGSRLWSQREESPRGEEPRAAGAKAQPRDPASDRGRIRPSRSPVRQQAQVPSKRERRLARGDGLLVPQDTPQEFSLQRARKLRDELDDPRQLVNRDVLPAAVEDLLL